MQIVLQFAFHYSFCFMNRDIRKTKEIHWRRRMHWVFFANEQLLHIPLKCAVIPQYNRRGHSSKIFPTLRWCCQVGLPLGVIVPVWCRQKATFTFSQASTINKNGLALSYRVFFPPQQNSRTMLALEVELQINKNLSRAEAKQKFQSMLIKRISSESQLLRKVRWDAGII